jgi:cobalt-precorrin-5B (C1)-methyltransferase
MALLDGDFPDVVTVHLPEGRSPSFPLAHRRRTADGAEAGVIKDAGDDPDVTHGALVIARLRLLAPGAGLVFRAGDGVGTVTRPGLPLPPGEPAINPGPRAMIADNLRRVWQRAGRGGAPDGVVEIAIPGGAMLAEKTLNGRLGIIGGLSVLGTTGVVVPYSCAAWVHSIHRAVDVARAGGLEHLAAVTGKASEAGLRALYPDLEDAAVIDAGDFIGGFLKYLRKHPVARVTLAAGFAKASKLAAGHLNLHSKAGEVDIPRLAALLRSVGGTPDQVAAASAAGTALGVLDLARAAGLPLADAVATRARKVAFEAVEHRLAVDVAVFDRTGRLVGHAKVD